MFAALATVAAPQARADRNVVAPTGLIAPPNSAKLAFVSRLDSTSTNRGWLTLGLPPDSGLEIEAERIETNGLQRETFGVQYSLTGNAFSDLAPAISVGVRDALNRAQEGRALYVAATKTLGLSAVQEHVLRDWKLHVGYGTNRMNGAFVGMRARFTLGLIGNVEFFARRLDASVAWPVGRHFNLEAFTIGGDAFYGASFVLGR